MTAQSRPRNNQFFANTECIPKEIPTKKRIQLIFKSFFDTIRLSSIRNGGRSSVGRASDCDSECRGFKPRRSPQFHFQ